MLLRLALVLIGAAVLVAPAGATAGGTAVTTVRVTARDYSFRLSRSSVPRGMTRFVVTNGGAVPHDFALAGRKTKLLKHGERATLLVKLPTARRVNYRCTVVGHAAIGMKGQLVVGKPRPSGNGQPPAPPPPPPADAAVSLTPIGKFNRPVFVTAPPHDSHDLFVVEQQGVVRLVVDGTLRERPFLDITPWVNSESETGLLSLAFAPDYETSGRFYVYFNDHVGNHNINVVEFRRSSVDPEVADPYSYRQVLMIEKPWENHNAGMMQFGTDGDLYIAVGDGDSGVLHKPGAFAQTLDDLLGSILRIDPTQQPDGSAYGVPSDNPFVGVAGDRPEVWAYGLRNPWRFDLDPVTGDLYLGDVGEGNQEEIDLIPAGTSGENFGWPCFEGKAVFDPTSTCVDSVPPLFAYDHSGGACGVIAGDVVRDPRLPGLAGRLLYSDLCTGAIRSIEVADGALVEDAPIDVTVPEPTSFGTDGVDRIYVTSLADGGVYRLDPAP
jgi:glucose/arabinose dehydrogenase